MTYLATYINEIKVSINIIIETHTFSPLKKSRTSPSIRSTLYIFDNQIDSLYLVFANCSYLDVYQKFLLNSYTFCSLTENRTYEMYRSLHHSLYFFPLVAGKISSVMAPRGANHTLCTCRSRGSVCVCYKKKKKEE